MTGFKISSFKRHPRATTGASETIEMLFEYAKKQTVKPILGASRWIGFGIVAALCLSVGLVFGALGILRLIQTFNLGGSANWTWLAYVVTLIICLSVFWLAISRIRKGTLEKS